MQEAFERLRFCKRIFSRLEPVRFMCRSTATARGLLGARADAREGAKRIRKAGEGNNDARSKLEATTPLLNKA
jgi:hypothetical protein